MTEDLTEFALIERYFAHLPTTSHTTADKSFVLGIGDDAAIVSITSPNTLLIACETLTESMDLTSNGTAEKLGPRLVHNCVNRLRHHAVGRLGFALLTIALPEAKAEWFEHFSQGLSYALGQFNLPLIGGDTTQGPLTITLTVYGWSD